MKSNSSLTAYLAALPVQDRVAARSKSVPSPLEAWLWGLSAWGQLVQTRAGYALALEAFSQWKTFLTQSPDQNWPEAECLEKCWKQFQAWIDTRDHTSFTELKTLQPELAQFLNIVDLNIAEGSSTRRAILGSAGVLTRDFGCIVGHRSAPIWAFTT